MKNLAVAADATELLEIEGDAFESDHRADCRNVGGVDIGKGSGKLRPLRRLRSCA